MELLHEGRVAYIFPDYFDIDRVIGMQNLREDWTTLKKVCMSEFESDFSGKVQEGDVIVGGKSFGFGHAHPQSMETMSRLGINTIIAESFSSVFYRGEIGNGRILLIAPNITKLVDRYDRISVDFVNGVIHNLSKGTVINAEKPSETIVDIVRFGGNKNFLMEEIKKREINTK